MRRRTFLTVAAAGIAAAGCTRSKFKTYRGPEITGVVINKTERKMYLVRNGTALKTYSVDLGRAPAGPKQFEGDGKTPEGTYLIDKRNPNSKFHLSLGISYPNTDDLALAESMGKKPGGDIFIHGQPNMLRGNVRKADWTEGCIAVKNREMEDIYAMVRDGTPITINP